MSLGAARPPASSIAVVVAVVVAVFAASPLHLPLNNPNEGVRVFVVKALVEHHTFAIDRAVAEWGYIDDKAKRDGRLYSSKAPLMSMLGALAYAAVHPLTGDLSRAALTRLSRGAGDAVPSVAVLLLLWRSLRRRVRDPICSDLAAVGLVLGSGVLASLNVFSGHALAALAPAAVLALLVEKTHERWHLPVIGLLLASAVGAEYPALLACVPLAVLALVREHRAGRSAFRAIGALVGGGAPVVVAVASAHTLMFGAPWRTGYSFLENPGYRDVVAGSFFGIGGPDPSVLGVVLFSPELGLFFFSPFLLVGLVWTIRAVLQSDERPYALAVLVAVALLLLFIAGFRGWRGGWSVGPRYISEMAGLLIVPTALAFDAACARQPVVARAAFAALVAAGLLHAGVAGMFFPHLSDVFRNPVYEMMLPVVALGASPDGLPLWLGLPARASSLLLIALLAVPLLIVVLSGGARTAVPSAGAALLTVVVLLGAGPLFAHTHAARAALETRRLLENWRPTAGLPLLEEAGASSGSDPRSLFAIGRARDAWMILGREGCLRPPSGKPSRGLLATTPHANDPDALILVPDRHAMDIWEAAGARAFFATKADLEAMRAGPVPCKHVYVVGAAHDALPRPLARWRVVETEPLPTGSLEVRSLHRPDGEGE